jgi:hypothetical protein
MVALFLALEERQVAVQKGGQVFGAGGDLGGRNASLLQQSYRFGMFKDG